MKRYMPVVLVALLALVAAQAGAVQLLQNGSFQNNNFSFWTIGTTSNGTWGSGYPVVAPWPLGGGLNSAKGEVGEVNFDQTQQGGTLSQAFTSGAGAATLSFAYAAMGDGTHTNADGGDFTLILDGKTLATFDVGQIGPNDLLHGSLTANVNLTAGQHTFEIEVTRMFLSNPGNTPYQYVTSAVADGPVPEPGTILLMGSGVLGLAGVLRRKIGF
jgi:hypothetical protein